MRSVWFVVELDTINEFAYAVDEFSFDSPRARGIQFSSKVALNYGHYLHTRDILPQYIQ